MRNRKELEAMKLPVDKLDEVVGGTGEQNEDMYLTQIGDNIYCFCGTTEPLVSNAAMGFGSENAFQCPGCLRKYARYTVRGWLQWHFKGNGAVIPVKEM